MAQTWPIFDVVAATSLMAYPPPPPFRFVLVAHPLIVVVGSQEKVRHHVRSPPCGVCHWLVGVILQSLRVNDLECDLYLPITDSLGTN